jgi:hypothetical protein
MTSVTTMIVGHRMTVYHSSRLRRRAGSRTIRRARNTTKPPSAISRTNGMTNDAAKAIQWASDIPNSSRRTSACGIARSIHVRATRRRSAGICASVSDEMSQTRPDCGSVDVHQRDVGLRLPNGEWADALAIDRETVVQRALRCVADARDRFAEIAVHQKLQVTGQPLGVSPLAFGDLHETRG